MPGGSTAILRLLLLALFAYGCYAVLLFFSQRLVIYPGRSIRTGQLPSVLTGIDRLWLDSGQKTEAWFLPARGGHAGRRPAVLFFHGNGEVIDYLPDQVEELRKWGMGVLLVEFPGFGRSGGTPSEVSITAAAVAAYDTLLLRPDVNPRRIVAFGRSLGCGAACALSRKRSLAGLILHAPFTSLRDFAPRFLLPRFLIRDVFDNREALRRYPGPVLILHGKYDDVIPVFHGRELAGITPTAELVEMNCSHNDCPPGWQDYWGRIRTFMAAHDLDD